MTQARVTTLSSEQTAQVEELVEKLAESVKDELRDVARLLIAKPSGQIFGETEFQVRDIVLRVGAKAFQEFLAQKKTAMSAAEPIVPSAGKRPSSTATEANHR
jgi:hypothetical protein